MKKISTIIISVLTTHLLVLQNVHAQGTAPCTATALLVGTTLGNITDVANGSGGDCAAADSPASNPTSTSGCSYGWYTFTAPANVPVSLDLQTTPTASDQDARIELYSSSNGTCSGTLTKRGCDTDGPGTGGAQVTYTSASTTTYFVRITDFACNANVSYSLALSFDILADADKTINIDCGATYNFYDSGGPGGDGTGLYGNSQNNDVIFVAPAGQSVRLTFKNVWRGSTGYCSTGNGYNAIRIDNGQTGGCSVGDYLTIYDGAAGSNIVGVYTGTTAFYPSPGTIISSGNTLTVNFTSGTAVA
jgi:hypothetical protein